MIYLPKFIKEMIEKIESAGFEAYAVGGCIRDLLLGRKPSDWDITTSALPENILNIFYDFPTIPVGISHGTVSVVTENGPVEITTYRIDGEYLDSRHPLKVMFSKKISDDLSRRDFTINSMAYNPRLGLVDLFGGKADLDKKVVRCVGEPSLRFGEDALRIMRALRFAAVLGFKIDDKTSLEIFSCKDRLRYIARERIAVEISKLILADNPCNILTKYSSVFASVLGFENIDRWSQNSISVFKAEKSLSIRLALLLDGMDSVKILKGLSLDNKTVSEVKLLSSYLNQEFLPEGVFVKKLLSKIGADSFCPVLKAKEAKFPKQKKELNQIKQVFEKIVADCECYSIKQLAVNGCDLKNTLGIKGIEIGKTLSTLLDAVIEGKCENTKSELLRFAKNKSE